MRKKTEDMLIDLLMPFAINGFIFVIILVIVLAFQLFGYIPL